VSRAPSPTGRPRHGVVGRLAPFGTTIFAEMTRLANEHGAINLAQGFPDFDGPGYVKDAAVRALLDGHNQYARLQGVPDLGAAIAGFWERQTGRRLDPAGEVTVTSGCTEGLAATLLGLVEPGDEVVLFEPYYDCYRADVVLAGGVVRTVTLRATGPAWDPREHRSGDRCHQEGPPAFTFDAAELEAAFTERTRAIVLNTPHNPTGKVFTRAELGLIAELCVRHDVLAITDEVYERLVFADEPGHIRLATLPGMWERTVTLSSLGKTFGLTGWKIGWAIAPPPLSAAVRAAHQFLTFCAPTPLQHGAACALSETALAEEYARDLVATLRRARDYLAAALVDLGLTVYRPDGTYFIMADHTPMGFASDVEFCRHLTAEIGVAAIPPSVFYATPGAGARLARFAFCKRTETLEEAVRRLRKLRPR